MGSGVAMHSEVVIESSATNPARILTVRFFVHMKNTNKWKRFAAFTTSVRVFWYNRWRGSLGYNRSCDNIR